MKICRAICAVMLGAIAAIMFLAVPAHASCVGPPATSPNMFTGTVLSVKREGLVATVKTDDGRTVEVRGTPFETGVTSVDRTYVAGSRYEFHPINASSPYEDNACTATRLLDGGAAGGGSGDVSPNAGGSGAWMWGLTALAVILAAGGAALVLRLRRRRSVVSRPNRP